METRINLIYAREKTELDRFWEKRDEYYRRDIIPHRNVGDPLTKKEIAWFFSKAYRDHLMMLYQREIDPLYIVLINEGTTNIGFSAYVIYNSEDGKCFILDYCIYPEYRSKGAGERVFNRLQKDLIGKGAAYIDLNISNKHNERFWTRMGFKQTEIKDERNKHIYRKILGGNPMNLVYLITGAPGVGKSTISKRLAESMEKSALIEGDDIYRLVRGGYVKPWLKGNHLEVFWENCMDLIHNFTKKGYDVVFNYICTPEDIENIKRKIPEAKIKLCILVTDEETLRKRDQMRPEDCRMGERSIVLLEEFAEMTYCKKHYLDTSALSVEETVKEIMKRDSLFL